MFTIFEKENELYCKGTKVNKLVTKVQHPSLSAAIPFPIEYIGHSPQLCNQSHRQWIIRWHVKSMQLTFSFLVKPEVDFLLEVAADGSVIEAMVVTAVFVVVVVVAAVMAGRQASKVKVEARTTIPTPPVFILQQVGVSYPSWNMTRFTTSMIRKASKVELSTVLDKSWSNMVAQYIQILCSFCLPFWAFQ